MAEGQRREHGGVRGRAPIADGVHGSPTQGHDMMPSMVWVYYILRVKGRD